MTTKTRRTWTLLFAVAGAVILALLVLPTRGAPPEVDVPPVMSPPPPLAAATLSEAGPVLKGIPSSPAEAEAPGVQARILVVQGGEPVPDAAVQILREESHTIATRIVSPIRTRADGMAFMAFDPNAVEGGAYVEAARATKNGFSRSLATLDVAAARAGSVQVVELPETGTFEIDLSELPPDARPRDLNLNWFPANEWHAEMLASLPNPVPVPPLSQGLGTNSLQYALSTHLHQMAVGVDGRTEPIHLPPDHVVSPMIQTPSGWTMTSFEYGGPVLGRDKAVPIFAIRPGVREAYKPFWKQTPVVEVEVVDQATGRPVVGAYIVLGVRPPGGHSRVFVEHREVTEGIGVVPIPYSLGVRLPEWVEKAGSVLTVIAEGYRSAVRVFPFSWSPQPVRIELLRDRGLEWSIEGRLLLPDGRPAAEVPLVVAPETLRLAQLATATTDWQGAFRMTFNESTEPFFEEWHLARFRLTTPFEASTPDGGRQRYERYGLGEDFRGEIVPFPRTPGQPQQVELHLRPMDE